MLIRDLCEAERKTLPIAREALRTARGSYASLIAVMNPRDFIRLTTGDDNEFDIINSHEFPGMSNYDPKQYGLPWLNVLYPSGQVTGHEGRHRAAMVLRAGGTSFPCVIYFRSERIFIVRYEKYNPATDEGESLNQKFHTAEERNAFVKELETLNKNLDQPFSYHDIRADVLGGSSLRGHPGRSDFQNWKYAAWKPTDMPPYLIGQFNPSVKVPTATMRIGVVKGHRHYAKDL